MHSLFRSVLIVFLCGSVILDLSCKRNTSPAAPNMPPHTRLANVPKDNDTVFALVTLWWNAGDFDGFIARYQYRYFTYHHTGDGVNWVPFDSTGWTDTLGTGAVIAFNSTEALNKQIFLVRAVDNDGNADPLPAQKILYTTRTAPPVTKILNPAPSAKVLVTDHITDWWSGVDLSYKAVDGAAEGKIVEYAWSVDGSPWTWVPDTAVSIPPQAFRQPLSGQHLIKVTSRNNTNLVDPVGDSITVTLVVPSFAKKVLVIDETDEFNNPFITLGTSDQIVDGFYADVFPGSDAWDFKAQGMPPRDVLAQYQLVVWHADDVPATRPHRISDPQNIAVFTDYLRVGGKFVMSGWRILKSFAYFNNFPFTFTPGTFVYDYLHIKLVTETDILGDMTYGVGKPGSFSNFWADSSKLAFFPYNGKFSQVNIITSFAGFTDVLYSYQNDPTSPFVSYRGRAIALRYYGTVFDAAVFGFPMYFVRKDDAKVMAQEILRSMHVQ